MKVSIIVAMDAVNTIGSKGRLPWNIKADLQWFRKHTFGKPIIMGRKTYESIGSPLMGRTNIIITRNRNYTVRGAIVVTSLEGAIITARNSAENVPEVMVIGGADIYKAALPLADKLYLTRIAWCFIGDTFFPSIEMRDWVKKFQVDHKRTADEYGYSFKIYERLLSEADIVKLQCSAQCS